MSGYSVNPVHNELMESSGELVFHNKDRDASLQGSAQPERRSHSDFDLGKLPEDLVVVL